MEISNQYKNAEYEYLGRGNTVKVGKSDYDKIIREKIEDLYEKAQNPENETAYQIGGEAYTEEEWEKLLSKFDSISDEMRELMRERHAKAIEEKNVIKESENTETEES